MDVISREEMAATFAGMHALIAVLIRRLDKAGSLDIVDVITDIDRLYEQTEQHPLSRAVQNDLRETLLGLIPLHPDDGPVIIRRDEVSSVAPLRQSPGFPGHDLSKD